MVLIRSSPPCANSLIYNAKNTIGYNHANNLRKYFQAQMKKHGIEVAPKERIFQPPKQEPPPVAQPPAPSLTPAEGTPVVKKLTLKLKLPGNP